MTFRAVVAAVLVALPAISLAEPAVVRVFEAPARTAPSKDAAVAHVFAENAQVSVSEEATAGFRRVRLPDGSTAWIEEQALAFPGKEAAGANRPAPVPAASPAANHAPPPDAAAGEAYAPPVPPPAAAALGAPDLRARIYVKDIPHLAQLVGRDPSLRERADRIVTRRRAALWTVGLGSAASLVFLAAAIERMGASDPYPVGDPRFMQSTPEEEQAKAYAITSVAIGVAAWVVGPIVAPGRNDILDLVNDWNARHPDEPFSFTGGVPPGAAP